MNLKTNTLLSFSLFLPLLLGGSAYGNETTVAPEASYASSVGTEESAYAMAMRERIAEEKEADLLAEQAVLLAKQRQAQESSKKTETLNAAEAAQAIAQKTQARITAAERKKVEARREARREEARRQARREARREARVEQERREARQARRAARIVTTDGILGPMTFRKGKAIFGTVSTSVANIPNRTSNSGWASSMRKLTSLSSDFIVLNEVSARSTESIQALAPAYGIVRGERDYSQGGSQSLNNVVLYRGDTWTRLAGGMVKVVNDDRGYMGRDPFVWDRFATWALLRHADGSVVSVISTHMPTNPGKYPRQHGNPPASRIVMYARGMEKIKAMEAQLSAYGPVLIGGDMNSHASQGWWTAAGKLATAGYSFTKDSGVMHLFYKNVATLVSTRQFSVASDHPALTTTVSLNGLGPA